MNNLPASAQAAEIIAHWGTDRDRDPSGQCVTRCTDYWGQPAARCTRTAGHGLTGRFCWQHDPWHGETTVQGLIRMAGRDPLALVDKVMELRHEIENGRLAGEHAETGGSRG